LFVAESFAARFRQTVKFGEVARTMGESAIRAETLLA
jgi:hypothetical protein